VSCWLSIQANAWVCSKVSDHTQVQVEGGRTQIEEARPARAERYTGSVSSLTEVGRLVRVAIKHPRDAFVDAPTIDAQWKALDFTAPPDLPRAIDEYDRFVELLKSAGAAVDFLPHDRRTTLDSIYARDASIVTPRGMILCRMGKAARDGEPAAQEQGFTGFAPPVPIAGRIEAPGRLEGGDLIWLDDRTVVVGRGYRSNGDGIRQLRVLLGPDVLVVEVPLPHWRGERDVMHLMSLLSPVDHDLAVVYSPLLPVPAREWLLDRGLRFVEVPDEEFATMGTNVLAVAPRRCVMLIGNPRTRAALERAGAEVMVYEGQEISVKGAGGPTCLTRPIVRGTL
jgi:N-dimethylarginine dimethylaminohydrolase